MSAVRDTVRMIECYHEGRCGSAHMQSLWRMVEEWRNEYFRDINCEVINIHRTSAASGRERALHPQLLLPDKVWEKKVGSLNTLSWDSYTTPSLD